MSSVEKVYRILELLRRHYRSGLSNKEISNRLKMPASTCYRLMKYLRQYDFVSQRQVDKRFFLGFAHLRYADAIIGGMDIPAVCLPYLECLHEQTRRTALLSLFSGQHAIVMELCGNIDLLMSIGRGEIMPFHCAASGKAILAFLPEAAQERVLESIDYHVFTARTITDPVILRAQLAEVCATGLAYNIREFHPDTIAVAAPIFKRQNVIVGSMAVVTNADTTDRDKLERDAALLQRSSTEASKALGVSFPAGERGNHPRAASLAVGSLR